MTGSPSSGGFDLQLADHPANAHALENRSNGMLSSRRTQLLVFDWELYGLIDPYEVPGPLAGVQS